MLRRLAPGAEHHFVLADARVGDLQHLLQADAQVVGVHHRQAADVCEAVAAEGSEVGVARTALLTLP